MCPPWCRVAGLACGLLFLMCIKDYASSAVERSKQAAQLSFQDLLIPLPVHPVTRFVQRVFERKNWAVYYRKNQQPNKPGTSQSDENEAHQGHCTCFSERRTSAFALSQALVPLDSTQHLVVCFNTIFLRRTAAPWSRNDESTRKKKKKKK
ncbi:hypothetical protein IWZ03DRAFT_360904 [Phyllosticta citriasiana]|uniref:Secreted protein n=1 Tax=Phyllosticta citriasiana TaxID=595635 RepID=A0ABR1KKV3_9PEZI